LSRIPIVEGVMKYLTEENVPFSMPGHKAGRGFLATKEGRELYNSMIKGDTTEVEGLDNLHGAEGVIKEAQELLRSLYGSKKSYFLVNGSTSGNLAMIFAAFNEGDKVIVERNCHRSVFNAVIMRKLKPIYIRNRIDKTYNAPFSVDMEHFLQLIDEHKDAKGIIITYPNYYGVCTDLEGMILEGKKRNIKILVDSAHGAHFGINELLPESALKLGADMVVMSAHKTLPSLTQTAYLHIGDGVDAKKVDFYVSAFTSTSPSYMFLSSLDYARFYMETEGNSGFRECVRLANEYREKINLLKDIHVISAKDIKTEGSAKIRLDESRYIINLARGYSGHLLLKYLRSCGVQAEMSDQSNVVLIFSPFNKEEDFDKLYEALKGCSLESLRDNTVELIISSLPEPVMLPYEAFEKKKIKLKIGDSVGRVSAGNIVPYPPGIPLIMLGERIEKEAVSMIKYYLNNNITVLGVDEDSVEVVDNL
jgi:arginine/lysine/ornithine decarboxylase